MADPVPPRRRVLVIDDEESIRHALRRGLDRLGWDCDVAATGKEGVDLAARGGYAAILTDLKLPDLSGLDVVGVLTETAPDVPVVVMTGYGTVESALEAMRRGAKDYVRKPFGVDEVARSLEKAVADAAASSEARRLRARVERSFSPEGWRHVDETLGTLREPAPPSAPPPDVPAGPPSLDEARRRFEVKYVEELLARTGGNVAAAARLAGITRPNLHRKIRALGVDPARFKRRHGTHGAGGPGGTP